MNVAFQSMKREHRKQKGHTSKSDIWGIDDQSIARFFSQTQLQYLKNKYVILRMVKDTYHPHSSI